MAYASARDLPKVRDMERNLSLLKVVGFFSTDVRRREREIRQGIDDIVTTVDGIYSLLGERHWIFHVAVGPSHVVGHVPARPPWRSELQLARPEGPG